MAEETISWTETVNSPNLQALFGSFQIEIPDDPTNLSFAKGLLEASQIKEFVEEIKSLAKNVVLCKHIRKDEDIRPGTVYVYEVDMRYRGNHVVIDDKDKREWTNFFVNKDYKDVVKVIIIHSRSMCVIEAKKIVFELYSDFHYIQHVSEDYAEISKLSAHQKIIPLKRLVNSIRKSIPLDDIENIIKRVADRALSKEKITQSCFDAVIQDSGNTNSDPYLCRSSFTIDRLKRELVEQTLHEVTKSFGSEIFSEMQKCIASEVSEKLDPGELSWGSILYESAYVSMLATIVGSVNLLAGTVVAVAGFFYTFIRSVDVNSHEWRREVAKQIHVKVNENRRKTLEKISSNIKKRCQKTTDQLKSVCDQLEDFRKRIDVVDLKKLKEEWDKRDVLKNKSTLKENKSIINFVAGRKNGKPVVKVFLRYHDKTAINVFKENENIEVVTIDERIKELSEIMKKISINEKIQPAVERSEKKRFGQVINKLAAYCYANHTNVVGFGISNVRCIGDNFIPEPCIVIYCLDKSIIPYGESKLPETIEGCPCDLREDMVMFGTCTDCRKENASPGCSVGMSFSCEFGSAGFLAKSNASFKNSVTGFLTAAHVAVRELQTLYQAESLLSECKAGKEKYIIVHPSWGHSANSESIGEVLESYCGNYQTAGMDAAFVRNYKPTPGGQILLQIAKENDFDDVKGTLVRKRGRATGETEGILVSGMSTVFVNDSVSPVKYRFDYCYEIKSKHADEQFFKPGDSGSGVYLIDRRGKKKAIGIAFAHRLDGTAYACRIEQITRAFNVSLYDVEETPMDTS